MENRNNLKAWIYLLPALFFLGCFMLYPLVDVVIYSFEENFKFTTQTFTGIGFGNYVYIFRDYKFIQALKNTTLLVVITVPISTILSLLIAVALNSIKPLKKVFQTIFFLPYVTNTLAVGLVFMIMFDLTPDTIGLVNSVLGWFNINPVDWLNGAYWSKIFVLSLYIIWNVMPFKILVLVGALQSVKKEYYDAAKIDHASKFTTFRKITVPMISPMISYLVITGLIGSFKEYNNAVGIFGSDLNFYGMNTIVGCVYNYLYSVTGGYPSRAAAAAIVLFGIIMAITIVNLLISKKTVHY